MKNFIQTYKFVPLKILIPIYDALFSTCIVYSLVVCSYTFTDNIEKLIKLQKKKCLPLATFSNYLAHLTLIFNSLKIIQLDSILNFHLSTLKSSLLWCIKTVFNITFRWTEKIYQELQLWKEWNCKILLGR